MAFIQSFIFNGFEPIQREIEQIYINKEFNFTSLGSTNEFIDVVDPSIGYPANNITNYLYPPNITSNPSFSDLNTQKITTRSIVSVENVINSLFGHSVSIGSDKVVVGAPKDTAEGTANKGAVYIFEPSYESNSTTEIGYGYRTYKKITRNDSNAGTEYGWCVACASNRIAVGAPGDDQTSSNSGAIFLYDANGNFIKKIRLNLGGILNDSGTNRYFGSSISIGSGRIVAGSYNDNTKGTAAGAVYIFDLNGNVIRKIYSSDAAAGDNFGWSVSVSSNRIVVGAPGDDDNGSDSGSAYIFDLAGNQIAKIKPPSGQTGAEFGRTVAVGQQRIIVGCPEESYAVGSTSYTKNGAAYLFGMSGKFMKRLTPSAVNSETYQQNNAEFGASVAIGETKIIIGQPFRDTASTKGGNLFGTDLNGNTVLMTSGNNVSSNSTASASYHLVSGNTNYETLGVSCAIGNGLICVGGSGITELGIGEAWSTSNVNGRVRIGRSTGISHNTTYSSLDNASIPGWNRNKQSSLYSVTRNRDTFDILDER